MICSAKNRCKVISCIHRKDTHVPGNSCKLSKCKVVGCDVSCVPLQQGNTFLTDRGA